jgi:hypothetical protein
MSSGASYQVHHNAQTICAHAADEDNHGFFVGTASLTGSNEVRVGRDKQLSFCVDVLTLSTADQTLALC